MIIGGANQYYPTPPEAALPLLDFCLRNDITALENVVDPAAGMGALPTWLAPLGAQWAVWEIDGRFRKALEGQPDVCSVRIEDGLKKMWPKWSHVIANPPYGKALWNFVSRIEGHCRTWGTFGAVLTRITWWGENDRGRVFKPDVILWIEGRISFTADHRADTSSHCWAIWLPKPSNTTRIEWTTRGKPTVKQQKQHRAMLGIPDNQIDMFEECD